MDHTKLVFVTGWTRAIVGLLALLVLPLFYTGLARYRLVFVAYLVFACAEQVLIWKDVGGKVRSFVAGLVDLTLLTFIVHRVGSVATPLTALYFFSGVLNALAVGLRVGMSQAVLGSVAYASVVVAESAGRVPYGPDAPEWAAHRAPDMAAALTAATLVATMLFMATGVVGALVHAVRAREVELADRNAKLVELSQRDPLTQLYNRRHLLARLEVELARLERGHPLALAMIDLDGFKRINDEQGHLRGDLLLQEVAAALAAITRATDVASRYGGDEFVVLLSDANEEQACAAGTRLVECVREVGARFDPRRPVTASLGLSFGRAGDSSAALLRRADQQSYRAKQQGGDRMVSAA